MDGNAAKWAWISARNVPRNNRYNTLSKANTNLWGDVLDAML